MTKNLRFARSSSSIGKIAFQCTPGTSIIISCLTTKSTRAFFSSSSILPFFYSRTTTSFQTAIRRANFFNTHSLSLVPKNNSQNFCRLNSSSRNQVVQYKSAAVGSWSGILLFSATILIYSIAFHDNTVPRQNQRVKCGTTNDSAIDSFQSESGNMADEALSGRPGSLTSEQEEKLKDLWALTLQVAGILDNGSTPVELGDKKPRIDSTNSKKPKKKRTSLFRRNKDDEEDNDSTNGTNEVDDKFGQTKLFNEAMANMTPESLRKSFWSMVKHDNPDALLLRFMRARRWDIEKALVMMISTMRWRLTEVHVDDDVIKNGELKALLQSTGSDTAEQKFGNDFLDQMRLGKSFLHGVDKKDRPLCLVRVRQHRIGEQSEESLERYTVYLIETARMVLSSTVDTASVLFDMTGFSMANMDYTPVKFMIKCFEANYPECLGVILVHKAPWVFQGIWKIIRGWLDPVVASKVQFTNTVEEMEQYINRSQIIKEFGGDEDWEYQYVEPILGENDIMNDTNTRDQLLREREKIVKEYEDTTREWIQANSTDRPVIYKKRLDIANSLRDNYWKLDPYLRARTYYDRIGVIKPGGAINHYPQKTQETESKSCNTGK
ncbi:CRAL-TRIO domain-containing protein C3H8.02 [Erysiphe neolycopersici]|uniref:CRAL-TRIO domain-containing protein C3H8.02 n=1 Tax=Erysiphe neolycopersici TaxID=212602 RepID=A0A420HEK9_9PEZI|nr:CRAL-TRIO domain-containing protein C3H8.02 [Erysiphe neolycopersici]